MSHECRVCVLTPVSTNATPVSTNSFTGTRSRFGIFFDRLKRRRVGTVPATNIAGQRRPLIKSALHDG